MQPVVLTYNNKRLTDSNGSAIFRYGTATILGTAYRTVKIGTQEWLAENFQYDDGGIRIFTIPDGMYHAGELTYSSISAVRVAALAGDGWRLPSYSDFEYLCASTGVTLLTNDSSQDSAGTYKALLGIGEWPDEDSTDSYGFDLLPIPFSSTDGSAFVDPRTTVNLWTSSRHSVTDRPYRVYINNISNQSYIRHGTYIIADTDIVSSIRLVRDIP